MVLVETVGVGQSEVAVAGMVDFFLVLMLPGAGDELQGIKKGILELADLIAVNKAEGEGAKAAQRAAADYTNALHLVTPPGATWQPPVVTCSALTGDGLDTIWDQIVRHRQRARGHRRVGRPDVGPSSCAGCGRWSRTACWGRCGPTRRWPPPCPVWRPTWVGAGSPRRWPPSALLDAFGVRR